MIHQSDALTVEDGKAGVGCEVPESDGGLLAFLGGSHEGARPVKYDGSHIGGVASEVALLEAINCKQARYNRDLSWKPAFCHQPAHPASTACQQSGAGCGVVCSQGAVRVLRKQLWAALLLTKKCSGRLGTEQEVQVQLWQFRRT